MTRHSVPPPLSDTPRSVYNDLHACWTWTCRMQMCLRRHRNHRHSRRRKSAGEGRRTKKRTRPARSGAAFPARACRAERGRARYLTAVSRFSAGVPSCSRRSKTKNMTDMCCSATGPRLPARPAPPSTTPNAYTTPTRTTAAKVSTRRILTTSRPATRPSRPSSKPSSTTPKKKSPASSSRYGHARAWTRSPRPSSLGRMATRKKMSLSASSPRLLSRPRSRHLRAS